MKISFKQQRKNQNIDFFYEKIKTSAFFLQRKRFSKITNSFFIPTCGYKKE
jgi:hypothetical protein